MRLKVFIEMLRQMAIYFTVSEVVSVIFVAGNPRANSFLLYMQNGEYWYITNMRTRGLYELFKFPPPIPSFDQLKVFSLKTMDVGWYPADLAAFLKHNGGSETLYMPIKDDEVHL
jgi:hypothetical protein